MQLSDKYRMHKKKIELIMDSGKDLYHDMYPLIGILKEKAEYALPLADTLNQLHHTGQLEISLLSLVSSYIHMMFNRIITSSPRLHELVLYDFLCRYYQSVMAREKQHVYPSAIVRMPADVIFNNL
jgi:thiopeptide-type bacteriocin biosynthesis protein